MAQLIQVQFAISSRSRCRTSHLLNSLKYGFWTGLTQKLEPCILKPIRPWTARNRPCTTTPEFPEPPVTARKNDRWIQSIPLSSRVFFCLLFSQSDWWIINQSFAIFCAFFDRWWEAPQGRVFRRARVKEIRESNGRPCRFRIKVRITFERI